MRPPAPRRRAHSSAHDLAAVTEVALVFLQLVFAVAVFRHVEHAFDREPSPTVARAGGAFPLQVSS